MGLYFNIDPFGWAPTAKTLGSPTPNSACIWFFCLSFLEHLTVSRYLLRYGNGQNSVFTKNVFAYYGKTYRRRMLAVLPLERSLKSASNGIYIFEIGWKTESLGPFQVLNGFGFYGRPGRFPHPKFCMHILFSSPLSNASIGFEISLTV